jgi:hypothetical protein
VGARPIWFVYTLVEPRSSKTVPLQDITGIDHAVVAVSDLDRAAAAWRQLGFTLSPRGTHSARMGTGNHTIMLGSDYIELVGVVAATELNAPTRAFLARTGGGIERIAFTTTDAASGAATIRARGHEPIGPTDFERPVVMPDGSQSAAKFSTYQWPADEAPGGVRLFACQHKTRDTVWIPELQNHANTARAIEHVLIMSPEPVADAVRLAGMIDGEVRNGADGTFAVPSGADRADFVFMTRGQLAGKYPCVALDGLPDRGGAALVLKVADLAAAERAVADAGGRSGSSVVVPPAAANGVLLAFVAG